MSHFVRTYKKRKRFLDELELGASISQAAAAAGGTVAEFRGWKRADPNFSADWDEAIESGTDFIEDVALERALKKSDPLMMMILRARRPEKYNPSSKLELSGGISVEGAKAKLLNKLAKLQAEAEVLETGPKAEQAVLNGNEGATQKILALPAPGEPIARGRKRRQAAGV